MTVSDLYLMLRGSLHYKVPHFPNISVIIIYNRCLLTSSSSSSSVADMGANINHGTGIDHQLQFRI